MSTRETDLLRRSTDALIRSRPVLIELFRPVPLIPDGFGGFTEVGEPTALEPRLRYLGKVSDSAMFSTEDNKGQNFFILYVMIGPYDDDIEPRDFFFLHDQKYIVAMVDPDRTYQTKAMIGSEVRVFVP